jgi:L-threonylcarbamoyladenylate synthase
MRIALEDAAKRLLEGEVVAIPTETVYGLAACYSNESAVEHLFKLKKRPKENPLILHVSDTNAILPFLKDASDSFHLLANAFWPGPLTLVLPVRSGLIPYAVSAGLNTQAFRVPAHPLTRELLKRTGPLVAPSANLSGSPSSVDPFHVETDFGSAFPVLDGGVCLKGVESTILIDHEGQFKVGRLGAIPLESLKQILGYLPSPAVKGEKPLCPGQLFRHYAPKAKLRFTSDFTYAPVIIGLEGRNYPASARLFLLSKENDPETACTRLYTLLRKIDLEGLEEAFIDSNLPIGGLWDTLRERLLKASSGP